MSGEILIVDDEPNMVRTLEKILERRGHAVRGATSGTECLSAIDAAVPDVLITDLKMPGMSGVELVLAAREKAPDLPVIVLTGHGTVETAVQAMKNGAFDYLLKPYDPEELLLTIERALEVRQLKSEVTQLRRQIERIGGFEGLVGQSPAMQQVYSFIQAVSRNRSNVLLVGESGTGKELVARAIHRTDAARHERPFVAVNCGALSPQLLESQLFGHKRGAFTGAISDHQGLFQAADGGTLFLDEVSELAKDLQVKFLRALEEREVTPLGSHKPIKTDVRIITASNRGLEECVRKGEFREDLYFRLNVVSLALPPLRERLDDLPLLIAHFVKVFSEEYGIAPKEVAPAVHERFRAYAWPGNVRELRNVIERAFALSDASSIGLEHLPHTFDVEAPVGATAATVSAGVLASRAATPGASDLSLESLERRQIEEALRRAGGKKIEAAKLLGINRKRLYRKLRKYGF